MMSRRIPVPVAVGLTVFVIFVFRTAPEIQCGDNGEFLTSAWHLGICHNPGYPVQSLVGHVLSRFLFPGSIGFRVNLGSAIWGAAAAGIFILICRRLTVRLAPALVGCALFTFSALFASQCTSAEVYASDVFFAALNFLVYLSFRETNDGRYRILLFFTLALGVVVHLSQILYVPVYLGLSMTGSWRHRKMFLLPALLSVLLASSIFLMYLPIRSTAGTVPDFRSPRNYRSFAALVSGAEHRRFQVMALPWRETLPRVKAFFEYTIIPAMSLPGLLVGFAGLSVWFYRRKHAALIAMWVIVANLVYGVWLNQVSFKATPMGLPALLFLCLAFSSVLDAVSAPVHSVSPAAHRIVLWGMIVPAFVYPFRNARESDRSDDLAPYRFGRYQQLVLPPGAALLVKGDDDLFIGLYLRSVERFRGDVIWIDVSGEVLPGMMPPADRFADPGPYMAAFNRLERWAARVSNDWIYYSWNYSRRFRPVGVNLFPGNPHPALLKLGRELFESWFARLPPDETREYQFRRMMSRLWFMHAWMMLAEGDRKGMAVPLEAGLKWGRDIGVTLRDAGILYMMAKQYTPAEKLLRKAIALDPRDELTYFFLAMLFREEHREDEAQWALRKYRFYFRRHFDGI